MTVSWRRPGAAAFPRHFGRPAAARRPACAQTNLDPEPLPIGIGEIAPWADHE